MDITKLQNSLKTPFAPLEDIKKNPHFAKLLGQDVSGYVSEMTGIHQYLYQAFIVEQYEEEIHRILDIIARTEMMHMSVLSETIVKLGGNPVFNAGGTKFWNAEYVNYTGNLIAMMNSNIAAEKQAIANYRMRTRQTNQQPIIQMLEHIISDEELHLAVFEEIRKWAIERSQMKMM